MPAKRSAAKRQRQSGVRRVRNRAIRSRVRTSVRRLREGIAASDAAVIEASMPTVTRELDRAVSKGVLQRNTAARYKGRLQRAAHPHLSQATSAARKQAADVSASTHPAVPTTDGEDAAQERHDCEEVD